MKICLIKISTPSNMLLQYSSASCFRALSSSTLMKKKIGKVAKGSISPLLWFLGICFLLTSIGIFNQLRIKGHHDSTALLWLQIVYALSPHIAPSLSNHALSVITKYQWYQYPESSTRLQNSRYILQCTLQVNHKYTQRRIPHVGKMEHDTT